MFATGISDLEGSASSTCSLLACQHQKFIWEKRIIIRMARDLEGNVSGLFCLIAIRERREFQGSLQISEVEPEACIRGQTLELNYLT